MGLLSFRLYFSLMLAIIKLRILPYCANAKEKQLKLDEAILKINMEKNVVAFNECNSYFLSEYRGMSWEYIY